MTPRGRARALRALWALGGALLGLACAEAGIAALRPRADIYLYEPRDGYVFNRPSFSNRFALVPESWKRGVEGRGGTLLPGLTHARHIRTNARGERDDREHALRPARAGLRILNLGDSMGFGWPVELRDSYLKQLERRLPDSETINCSVVGACPAEFTQIYDRGCSQYRADIVIAQVTIHVTPVRPDCVLTDHFGPHITLIRGLRRTLGERVYQLVERDAAGDPCLGLSRLDARAHRALAEAFTPRLWLYHSLHAVRLIENRWLAPNLLVGVGGEVESVLSGGALPRVEDAPVAFAAPTLRWLRRLRADVEARGATLVVLWIPTSFRAAALGRGEDGRPDVAYLKHALRADGVSMVDTEPLLGSGRTAELYFEGDYHPTPRGYGIVAEALAAAITRERKP